MSNQDLEIKTGITIPGHEYWFTTSRSSGPGGQHANKTDSRVTIYWVPSSTTAMSDRDRLWVERRLKSRLNGDGVLQLHADSERSQLRNKEIAKERLITIVLQALQRPKKRIATKPSRASQRRRIEAKKRRGKTKRTRSKVDPHEL